MNGPQTLELNRIHDRKEDTLVYTTGYPGLAHPF